MRVMVVIMIKQQFKYLPLFKKKNILFINVDSTETWERYTVIIIYISRKN